MAEPERMLAVLDGVWQPVRGRRRVLGLYWAVVLTLFLMRRNESQAVAGELFGCSQSTVFRIVCRLRPLLRAATAEVAGQVRLQAKRSAVLVDGFLAPTDNRTGVSDLFSGKRHTYGLNIQAVSDLAGRLVDTGLPVPGARHDSKALAESGIADRWASHLEPGGPSMLADLGYLGTGAITGIRKPRGADLTGVQRACNTAINSARAAGPSPTWSTGKSSTPAGADASPTSPKYYAPSPDSKSTEPGLSRRLACRHTRHRCGAGPARRGLGGGGRGHRRLAGRWPR
ncbi:transposase family protein [Micromonospora sp. NPDC000668]|uniref:transposase family protein n=1 Tax=Micromonospora sp. NPDC000668 TaxID=3364219 RepID=UPI0036AD72F8